jgi:hypothetical protein
VSACWTGSTFSASYTNICADVPLGLLGKRQVIYLWRDGDGAGTLVA